MELIIAILIVLLTLCGSFIYVILYLFSQYYDYSTKMLASKENRIKMLQEMVNKLYFKRYRKKQGPLCKVCSRIINQDDIARDCCDRCLKVKE